MKSAIQNVVTSLTRWALVLLGICMIIGIGWLGYSIYSSWTAQLANGASLAALARRLQSANQNELLNPAAEFDYWGHPILYVADAEHFILVSPGKDGHFDQPKYTIETVATHGPRVGNCSDTNADTIFYDNHAVQACLK